MQEPEAEKEWKEQQAEMHSTVAEPIRLAESTVSQCKRKKQHADDIALTQCILCVLLVLSLFALHWLKPEWQEMLLEQYRANRQAPPVAWLEQLIRSMQQWMQQQ